MGPIATAVTRAVRETRSDLYRAYFPAGTLCSAISANEVTAAKMQMYGDTIQHRVMLTRRTPSQRNNYVRGLAMLHECAR